MNKQTKTILGVALLGIAGYYLWKTQSKSKKGLVKGIDTRQCVGPVEITTHNPFENPVRCHYVCEGRNGDLINLGGNPPCPASINKF